MRLKCLPIRILMGKLDLEATHHRVHTNLQTTPIYISIMETVSLLYLQLTFITIPDPEEFIKTSET